jgi:hypothetical protein
MHKWHIDKNYTMIYMQIKNIFISINIRENDRLQTSHLCRQCKRRCIQYEVGIILLDWVNNNFPSEEGYISWMRNLLSLKIKLKFTLDNLAHYI